jgi:alpha-mannosidase
MYTTYSLFPHPGSWREAQTVRRGYELNYPLLSRQAERHQGLLKDEFSFLKVSAANIVVTAVKKAEDDGGLIVRFYEWAGTAADVKLQMPAGAEAAAETDLMERKIADLPVEPENALIATKPYEIRTVRFQFATKPPH